MRTHSARRWLAIALAHLIVVGLGAGYFPFHELGRAGDLLAMYGKLSGASSTYGFFAKDMISEVRARLVFIDAHGAQSEVRLGSGSSREADLRVGAIASEFFAAGEDDVQFQRSLAASLAASVFGQHPEAVQVIVTLEEQEPPSMAHYRKGERARWRTLYEVRFEPSTPRKSPEIVR